jgi:phosphate transport system protein
MGRYYEENYDLLKQKITRMCSHVQSVIARTIESLTSGNVELARAMILEDEEIDRTEVEIDELVLKLLALQAPMAIDLRFIITALKINNDLERMGDQAVNIAQAVVILDAHGGARQGLIDFTHMEDVVLSMVRDSIDSFTKGDAALARSLLARDDEVDGLNRTTIKKLGDHLRDHPDDASRCMSLLLVSRNLERIADLSTNIAEDVVYYIEGKIIKHEAKSPKIITA